MHRVLIAPPTGDERTVTIRDPRTLHHLVKVVRVQAGDRLDCFDGHGQTYAATVLSSGHQRLTLAIAPRVSEPPPRLRITLAQALIQPQRFEWLMQKATELGVSCIVPVLTSRTRVPRAAQETSPQRLRRWHRILEEAARQCGRATLPLLEPPQPFERVIRALEGEEALLLTLTASGPLLSEHVKRLGRVPAVTILIGPEGDFSLEEVQLAAAHGVRLARLAGTTLRSETAGLVALALLQHAAGAL